jgi:hypothetical protein
MTPGKSTATGSFNALAAVLTGQGSGKTDEEILNVNQQHLVELKTLNRRQASGGLVAVAYLAVRRLRLIGL